MSTTKKIWLIIPVVIVLILASLAFFWRTMKVTNNLACGGIVGIACPAGYECQTDPTISDDVGKCVRSTDPVYYDKSYGTTCPLNVQFLESKTSPTVDCECPDGYSMDRTVIGSTTGDACYGDGTECPLLAVSCIPAGN